MQGMSDGSRERSPATVGEQDDRAGLRALPSVERLLQTEPLRSAAAAGGSRTLAARCREAAAGALPGGDPRRQRRRARTAELAARAAAELRALDRPQLVPVINATGVVIHTNLGRAPLPLDALEALEAIGSGYSNLEYDVEDGARGSRHAHVEDLLRGLTGAQAALAVNNNAAAVLLAVAALAGGREVVVSRGQLVEIGGSFRIPEILAASGARLVEAGTTNRTRIGDYERAIGPDTAALMRAHPSNFRVVGFTEEPSLKELTELARSHGLPVIDDIGSGVLSRCRPAGRVDRRRARGRRQRRRRRRCRVLLGRQAAGRAAGRHRGWHGRRDRAHESSSARARGAHRQAFARRAGGDPAPAPRPGRRCDADPGPGDARRRRARAARTCTADPRRDRGGRTAGSTVRIVRASGRAGGGSLPLLELEGPVVAVEVRDGAQALCRSAAPGRPCDRRAGTRGRGAARPAHAVRRRGGVRRARSAGRAARAGMTDPALTLGTAGHIDHGKTSLVRALTGVDTDRLPEERERGISIELGFARMELPSGRRLSVVDVPGHERFVRTMVAGATGIDLFLLVVAADDGVMPQTREHSGGAGAARGARWGRRAHQGGPRRSGGMRARADRG